MTVTAEARPADPHRELARLTLRAELIQQQRVDVTDPDALDQIAKADRWHDHSRLVEHYGRKLSKHEARALLRTVEADADEAAREAVAADRAITTAKIIDANERLCARAPARRDRSRC